MPKLTRVKEVENAILFKDENGGRYIRIDNVRLSYPYLGTPGENERDNGKKVLSYSLRGLLEKETHSEAIALVDQVMKKVASENDTRVKSENYFMKDGDEDDKEEHLGHWVISASNSRQPSVRNGKGQKMDDADAIDNLFYGGCWGHILINPWFFNGKSKADPTKTYPKRVCASLESVIFAKDDKPFGNGRIDDSDAWGDMASNSADDQAMSGDGFDDDDDL